MPISADPNKTADYVLPSDVDKPADTRPTFICRFMTRRQYARVAELAEQAYGTPNTAEGDTMCYRLLQEAIAVGVIGWRNMKDPAGGEDVTFSVDNLDRVLSDAEIWTLVRNYPLAVRRSELDAKKSASPSASTGAPSASPAPQPAAA